MWEVLGSNVLKQTIFDLLKFSSAVRLRGHKERNLTDHVYSFLLFLSSKLHYHAEF